MDLDDDIPKVSLSTPNSSSITHANTETHADEDNFTGLIGSECQWAGHKNSSEQLPHAPKEETDRTMGKGKRHKADRD